MPKDQLGLAPFPPLTWGDGSWEGTDQLPTWAGFQARGGAYTSQRSEKLSDGTVGLRIENRNGGKQEPPSEEQVAAYRFLKESEPAVTAVVLKAIFEKYPEIQETYGDSLEEGELPDLESPGGLRSLIGLGTIHVQPVEKDGIAYLGFEMGCTWDDEHGLGVMLHKDRVIEVGGADTSFLSWIAEKDGGVEIWEEI